MCSCRRPSVSCEWRRGCEVGGDAYGGTVTCRVRVCADFDVELQMLKKEAAVRTQTAIRDYNSLTSPHVDSFNWVSGCDRLMRPISHRLCLFSVA